MSPLTPGAAVLRLDRSSVACEIVKLRAKVAEAVVNGRRVIAPLDRFTPAPSADRHP